MRDWLDWAIIAFIIFGITYVVWKGGQANPEGTGTLGQKVSGLSGKVSALGTRIGHVEHEMEELKQEAATTKDIARLEEKLSTVRAEIAGDRDLAKRTYQSVERIERFLIEKGLGGR
ncbi:MAG: hypothetical protein AB7L36_00635 [Sphingomonadaceae bacterium]